MASIKKAASLFLGALSAAPKFSAIATVGTLGAIVAFGVRYHHIQSELSELQSDQSQQTKLIAQAHEAATIFAKTNATLSEGIAIREIIANQMRIGQTPLQSAIVAHLLEDKKISPDLVGDLRNPIQLELSQQLAIRGQRSLAEHLGELPIDQFLAVAVIMQNRELAGMQNVDQANKYACTTLNQAVLRQAGVSEGNCAYLEAMSQTIR